MRRLRLTSSIAVCAVALLTLSGVAHANDDQRSSAAARLFATVLTGNNEVPSTTSTGLGIATLLLSSDGNTLYYSVEVSGASSTVNLAHIHLAPAGQNGDVVANLCGAGAAPACGTEGVIASGSITASSLVGPLAGHPLSDLVAALRNGSTYVNVHTSNFPGGELRGQIASGGANASQGDDGRRGGGEHHDHGDDDDRD